MSLREAKKTIPFVLKANLENQCQKLKFKKKFLYLIDLEKSQSGLCDETCVLHNVKIHEQFKERNF